MNCFLRFGRKFNKIWKLQFSLEAFWRKMVYNKFKIEDFVMNCFFKKIRQIYEVREDEEDGC